MKLTKYLALGALVVICGCQTVEDARKVQRNETPVPGEFTPTAQSLGLTPDAEFTMEKLEMLALENHPSIRAAINAADRAYLAIENTKADLLPSINTGVSYSRKTANVNKHLQSTRTNGSWSGFLNMNLIIYDFGKTDLAVKALVEEYNQALLQLETARNAVVYNVRKAYFELNCAIELHSVASQTVVQYKEHRDQVKTRKEVGSGTAFDLTKAEVDLKNAELSLLNAANTIETSWAALINAIGLAEDATFKITSASLKDYNLDMEELMEKARKGNPKLAELKSKEVAASISIDKAIAALYPSLSLELGASLGNEKLPLPWLWNLSGAASISQNLFNGNRNMIAIKQAALGLKSTRAAFAEYEQTLFLTMKKAVLGARLAQKQFAVSQEVEKQAKEHFDIVCTQYEVGKSSALERTDAQVSLSQAQANVVSAKYAYQEALASIANLIGDTPIAPKPGDDTPIPAIKAE